MSIRSHLLDVRPLREEPPFRALWIGTTISGIGSQLSGFALLYYVWQLTHSSLLVGVSGIVQAVPLVVFGLIGGTLADRMNRRTLLLAARVAQLVVAVVLAVVVLSGGADVVLVYGFMAAQSGLSSLAFPAAQTLAPRLLSSDRLSAGLALMRLSSQVAMLGGPLIAGILVARFGVGLCLVIDAVTFLAALWGVGRLPRSAAEPQRDVLPSGRSEVGEDGIRMRSGGGMLTAIRFLLRTPILVGAFVADLNATVLALPTAIFPAINAERFGGSPVTLGLMLPAIGLGGILAGVFSGRLTAQPRQGFVMLISCAVWGAGIALFGLSPWLPVALVGLAIAGAADTGTVVSRGTMVQRSTPDALRGRINSLDFLVGAGGPSLGNLRAGVVASLSTAAIGAWSGGLLCIAGVGVLVVAIPRLRRWRADAEEVAPRA